MPFGFLTSSALPLQRPGRNGGLCSRPLRARTSHATPARARAAATMAAALVTPADAAARKAAGWKHLDVRTAGEFARAHAPAAVNVPFLHAGPDGMTPNDAFLAEVAAAGFAPADRVVVSCASGARSARACAALAAAGYAALADMDGGMRAYADDPALPTEP